MADEKVSAIGAIKTLRAQSWFRARKFFQRTDQFAPNGGRTITMSEFKAISAADRAELGALAAIELGVELTGS